MGLILILNLEGLLILYGAGIAHSVVLLLLIIRITWVGEWRGLFLTIGIEKTP
jgi:accessory gene regulator protein AgrB